MMPIITGFARRENPDHTIDSICKLCFRTIAKSKNAFDLIRAEEEHCCSSGMDTSPDEEESLRGTF
jgi:hypothetical protein